MVGRWRNVQGLAFLAMGILAVGAALGGGPARGAERAAVDGRGYPLRVVAGARLMLAARINGHPVEALRDSAAETTLLDKRFAAQIKLSPGESVQGQGSGQSRFAAMLVDGVRLEAVGLRLTGQTLAITDLIDVGRRLMHRRVSVILGREIFDAARLSIDFGAARISVVSGDVEPPGSRLALVSEHGVETIPVRVEDGPAVRATFDLGNGSEVLISRAYADRMHLLSDGRRIESGRGGGLGGEAVRQRVTLRSIEIAGRRFESVPASIDPQSSASDVNVGVRILRNFNITTDFKERAVWLAPR